TTDKNTGVTTLTQGTVQKACFNSSGDSYLLVNDKVYDLSDVIEVLGYHSADSSGGSGDDGDGGSGSEPTNPTT
ncbi:MAG: cytochrome b5 domain-containing protein, partial [Oscillospiraceae bacterium]|nr:cytochrome b5 domain-containing protein [Oscillospiraceae bacterium]